MYARQLAASVAQVGPVVTDISAYGDVAVLAYGALTDAASTARPADDARSESTAWAGLDIRSTRIIDTSYCYFGLVLSCIDADLP